jgi:HSP20 family protein
MDMYEHKDELVMRVELPGVKKEDIDVSLEGDELTIGVEKKREEVAEEACYYCCERSFGHYSRTISLPFPVDADKISSTFENGLLAVKLPKAEAAKAKHIEVKVS